jgi:hypothetical protein
MPLNDSETDAQHATDCHDGRQQTLRKAAARHQQDVTGARSRRSKWGGQKTPALGRALALKGARVSIEDFVQQAVGNFVESATASFRDTRPLGSPFVNRAPLRRKLRRDFRQVPIEKGRWIRGLEGRLQQPFGQLQDSAPRF